MGKYDHRFVVTTVELSTLMERTATALERFTGSPVHDQGKLVSFLALQQGFDNQHLFQKSLLHSLPADPSRPPADAPLSDVEADPVEPAPVKQALAAYQTRITEFEAQGNLDRALLEASKLTPWVFDLMLRYLKDHLLTILHVWLDALANHPNRLTVPQRFRHLHTITHAAMIQAGDLPQAEACAEHTLHKVEVARVHLQDWMEGISNVLLDQMPYGLVDTPRQARALKVAVSLGEETSIGHLLDTEGEDISFVIVQQHYNVQTLLSTLHEALSADIRRYFSFED